MNEKTAKLIHKVAGIQVKMPEFENKGMDRIEGNLQATWKGLSPTKRGKMRRRLKHIVRQDNQKPPKITTEE